jgi:hypothetical protein
MKSAIVVATKNQTNKSETEQGHSLLELYKEVKPEGGLPVYKFENVGDAVVAKFIGRRQGIKTKTGTGNALDLDIIERSDGNNLGPHTIFESTGITGIFDKHNLKPGDLFFLKFYEQVKTTRFKRFSFKPIDAEQAEVIDPGIHAGQSD